MKPHLTLAILFAAATLAARAAAAAQAPPVPRTLSVTGHPGQVPVVQINGRSFADIEALARLTNASITFRNGQMIVSFPALIPASNAPEPPKGFSPAFLRAAIEELTDIREWRIAIVSAVQNNSAVTENWVGSYRRAADSKLALASAAATTDSDRSAFQLLSNEYRNMQTMSDQFLALKASVTFTPTTAFDNNPLDSSILACARALASMAASNQYQEESSCH